MFSIRLLRSSLVLTRLSRLLSHCSFSAQSWQCSIRCIRRSPRAQTRLRFSSARSSGASSKLTRLRAAFATPVALLLFCPVVAMLHPLHSPLASGANPFALFLGAVEWRFFEAYSPASGFITGTFSDAIPKPLIFLSNSLLCFFQPDKKPCLPLKLITFCISSCII